MEPIVQTAYPVEAKRRFPTRPAVMTGETRSIETPLGTAYITLNYHDDLPAEVFVTIGKAGSTERAAAEALARLLSVALQRGVPLKVLTKQLRGISSTDTLGLGPNKVLSMPGAVGRVLESFL